MGIKRKSSIKSGRRRTFIPKVKNDKGETITSRNGIANVFGEFYRKLYDETQLGEEIQESENMETRMSNENKSCNEDMGNGIPEFTQDEVQASIDKLQHKVKQLHQRNPGRRHQNLRRNDERIDQTDLQRSVEARGLHAHQKHAENTY